MRISYLPSCGNGAAGTFPAVPLSHQLLGRVTGDAHRDREGPRAEPAQSVGGRGPALAHVSTQRP